MSAEEPVSAEEASWWQAGSPGRQSRGRAEARIPERFLENYSPVSCQNREQQWRDQPPRTSSAEETPTLEVYFIFIYYHNTDYKFKNLLE